MPPGAVVVDDADKGQVATHSGVKLHGIEPKGPVAVDNHDGFVRMENRDFYDQIPDTPSFRVCAPSRTRGRLHWTSL
jgi:hypothetical protein